MTIFDALTMIGGLCLFLFGMNVMGDGLERRAGNGLKALLGKLTNSKIKGFLTGMGVTAVIQSSSATTVMVVGFVNSKLMTLRQSIGVIMGANIGTTVTAWILSLGGISGDNFFIRLLKPTSFTPVLALVGTVFLMFSKSDKKKDTGTILLGFATLMFGMDTMSAAVSGLADVPAFRSLFLMFENPILGVLVGAVLTGIIQSSSASVGILQALSATGAVTYAAAVPIIMGQNIGTCVTALLSSIGTNKNARRAAIVHLSFNVIGTAVWLTAFSILSAIFRPALLDASATHLGIAVAHTVFNVLCTALLLPMSSLLEKLAYKLVPDGKEAEKGVELDDRLLATPVIALAEADKLARKMAGEAVEGFRLALDSIRHYDASDAERIRKIESDTDHYEDILGTYLTKLSRYQVGEDDSAQVTKLLKAIGEKLATLDGNAVVAGFEKGELLRFELDGTMIELEKDDVLTAPMKKPGYVVATDRGVTVALDTNLTEALIAEGFAREVISKLQTMRKEAGFEVVDRIHVTVKTADEKLAQIVKANADAIERGVLALDVTLGDAPEGAYVRDWSINGVDATLSVAKA